jgi:hypothetical protein
MIFLKIPDWPARREGTCHNAGFTADAFFSVHGSDIAMPSINVQRSNRAHCNAGGLHALPALGYVYISGETLKRVLNNLYSGQRQALKAFMYERAGKHAGHAALALLGINQKISF